MRVSKYLSLITKSLLMAVVIFVTQSLCAAQPSASNKLAGKSNNVATGSVTKVVAPRVGKYTIGDLLLTLNKGYSGKGTFLMITDNKGALIVHEDFGTGKSGWSRYAGSTSVDAAFGAGFSSRLPATQEVTLLMDQDLINKMQADGRLPSGNTLSAQEKTLLDNALNRLFLYFIFTVNIGGKNVNYRFYINDPCPPRKINKPGRATGAVYPVQSTVADRFDCTK